MIVFTIISIIIFAYFLRYFGCCFDPGFYSIYDKLMVRGPFESPISIESKKIYESSSLVDVLLGRVEVKSGEFWVSINRWMMMVMMIAIVALIVNRILIIKKMIPEYKADIFVYAGVIEGMVIYLLTPVLFVRYEMKYLFVSPAGISFIVLISYCFTVIVICHYSYKKEKAYDNLVHPDKEKTEKDIVEEEKKNKVLKRVAITGIVLFEITLAMWFKAFVICMDYSDHYGNYEKEDHTPRADLEAGYLGNYQNQAVNTEKGLFYIASSNSGEGKEGDCKLVKKMDSDGNISEVFRGEDSHYSIGYYKGYLYLANEQEVLKVDAETGEAEKILTQDEKQDIQDFCIVDNRLYIQTAMSYEEIKRHKYNIDMVESNIYYFEIGEDKLSGPVLYLGDVIDKYGSFFDGEILSFYLMNSSDYHGYRNLRRQSIGQYYYTLNEQMTDSRDISNFLVISDRIVEENSIQDVGSFNVHNGTIYYIHLLEDGFELCKCGMDGTGSEVIDTYTDGIDYIDIDINAFRMAITDNKILVYSTPAYATDDETRDMTLIDSVEYVTDLK